MRYLKLDSMEAASYFAAEELLMEEADFREPVFMLWRTVPTVMLGCNQVLRAEVDIAEAAKRKVALVRRQSGGGAIYTDPGTLQYTLIMPYEEGKDDCRTMERKLLAEPMVESLAFFGIEASCSGRNDILADGRKISGLAQHRSKTRLLSHGSLLYDADMELLAAVLKPDTGKLQAKGIKSVRCRVSNVRQQLAEKGLRLTPEAFQEALLQQYAARYGGLNEIVLTRAQQARMAEIRRDKYASDAWTYGRDPSYTLSFTRRFPAGKVQLSYEVAGGKLIHMKIRGDFLSLKPIEELEEGLSGTPFHAESILKRLKKVPLSEYLGGITAEELIDCMMAG